METPSEKAAKAISNLIAMKRGTNTDEKFVTFAIKTVREATDTELAEDPTAGKFVFVEGILAGEEPDFEGEILDYKSSKPNFQRWNDTAAKLTGGKSVGNLRGQHNPKVAAGKFVSMEYDDKNLSIPCVAKVIDPVECDKVREGVYTSFSVGAHYARKWKDGKHVRWTADPFEGSLVDFGAIPMTRGFVYRAADGKEEERAFDGGRRELRKAFESFGRTLAVEEEDRVVKAVTSMHAARKGLYTVQGFAQLVQQLIYLRDSIIYEREMEGDASPVTDRVSEATNELLECLAAYTQEQVSEEIGKKNPTGDKTVDIKDVAKDLPANKTAATDPAAVAGTKPTDEQIATAVKGINDSLAILKAAGVDLGAAFKGYPAQPGSAPGGHAVGSNDDDKSVATDPKAKGHAELSKEDCKAADCEVHKTGKAMNDHDEDDKSKKCTKTANDCTDEKCMSHKGKTVAASDGALKRADVETLVRDVVTQQQKKFETEVMSPLGEQLKAIGETLAAMAGAPLPTGVSVRPTHLVTKDAEASKETQDAEKAIQADVKAGRTVDAVRKIREQPGHRVSW